MRCGAYSLAGFEGNDAGIYPLRCKRWQCPKCGVDRVRQTMARIGAGISLGRVRFFTLTSPGDEDAATSWAELPSRWKRFHQRVKRRYPDFEYIAVSEEQKRGHAHMHVLYRGPYIDWRVLRAMAAASGFGRIADIRTTNPNLARYMVKYLTKDLRAGRQQADGTWKGPQLRYRRRVRMSRNWCPPYVPEHQHQWSAWRILNGPPAHAAMEVHRAGYRLVELVLDRWHLPARFGERLRWLVSLRDRDSDRPDQAA
jgi:hypothetical protein